MDAPAHSKLKVGFVLDDGLDNPDGVQQYILAIGAWLSSQGHEVHYLVGETKRTDIERAHSMSRNVKVRFNGNSVSIPLPTGRRKLRRFLQKEQFDVLHVQVPYSPFMGHRLIMAAGKSTAVVGTFHIAPSNRLVTAGNRALGLWLHFSLKRFDAMLSVSEAAADFAADTFRIDSEISPNVIDYDRFHHAKPLKDYQDGKRLTVLFLGRLVPRKGCMHLLQAVAALANKQKLPAFRVVICGTGPLEHHLKHFVIQNKLDDIVEFAGFVTEEDKPRYYASADIAVFPSNGGESFGIVLLEALASGKSALIAGDNSGYRSVLVSRPELLVDPYDIQALSKRLAQYLQNTDLRKEIGAWGAGFAKGFDVDVVGKQLLRVYGEALHKRRNL